MSSPVDHQLTILPDTDTHHHKPSQTTTILRSLLQQTSNPKPNSLLRHHVYADKSIDFFTLRLARRSLTNI